MPHDMSSYISDIIAGFDSIAVLLGGVSMEETPEPHEKRSPGEQEFILIGVAVSMLSRFAPERFNLLSDGCKVIGFHA